jgi:hypothetical protein
VFYLEDEMKYKVLSRVEKLANTYQTNMYEKNLEQLRQCLTAIREALQFPNSHESRAKAIEAGRFAGRLFEILPGSAGGVARLVQLMAWVAEGDQQEIPCLLRQVESILAQYNN